MQRLYYVAYGSNLATQRFACYLRGGCAPGARRTLPGARDPAAPRADLPVFLRHRLRFAGGSPTWPTGVAFVDLAPAAGVATRGRAWLITPEQAVDVLCQENGWGPAGRGEAARSMDRARVDGTAVAGSGGRYGAVVALPDVAGHRAVTFTAPEPVAPLAAPDAPYLGLLARGLAESHGLDVDEAVAYLAGAPGIAGTLDERALRRRVQGAEPPRTPDGR